MQLCIRVSSDLHKHMPNVTTPRLRACMRLSPRTTRSHPRQRLSRHIVARVRPSVPPLTLQVFIRIYGKNHLYTLRVLLA